jgi:hypothetical protein
MELDIDLLKKNKIFIGTPMYGGVCHGAYAFSLSMLMAYCGVNEIPFNAYYIANESLITRARNYIADTFLRSNYDYLIFIDSDIEFQKEDVLELSQWASANSHMEIISGPYPKKQISWEKVKKASDLGVGKNDPTLLSYFIGDFALNTTKAVDQIELKKCIENKIPIEVNETGTGFMLIKRQVFEKFIKAYPERNYKPDHIRDHYFDGSREITAFFDCVIDPVTRRYLSEDYMFCDFVRKIGIKIWLLPWLRLNHVGNYIFQGNLEAINSINAKITADGLVKNLKNF